MGSLALAVGAALTSAVTLLAGSLAGSAAKPKPAGEVVTYPAPSGQALSSEYDVRVRPVGGEWHDLDVYAVTVDMDTLSIAAMVGFDFRGPVELSIAKLTGTPIGSARVRPASYGITPSISADGRTARFKLARPLNVSFEVNGDILHNVHVFTSPIERGIPRVGRNVMFFGPGVHTIPGDHKLRVPSNTTVYVAGGAVVRGSIVITNARNVVVRGRGVIDPSAFFLPGKGSTFRILRSSNVGVREVTLLRAQDGGFEIIDSADVVIANTREINPDRWSDGVRVISSSNVLVDGVFLRTSDDSIAVYASTGWGGQGGTRDVTVRNSTLWADVAHPIMLGAHGDPARKEVIERVDFQNIDILEHDEYRGGYLYQGAMAVNAGDDVTARGIRFEDIRIDDFSRGQVVSLRVFFNSAYNTLPGRAIDDVFFRNVSYRGSGDDPSRIEGYDSSRRLTNTTFENLTWNGGTVLDPSTVGVVIGQHVSNVTFTGRPVTETVNNTAKAIGYSGQWNRRASSAAYGADLHSTPTEGSGALFAFEGRQVRVYGATGPARGKVDVVVDGKHVATVDTYSRDPRAQQIWYDSGVLPAGSHRLELRCRGTKSILSARVSVAFDKLEFVR